MENILITGATGQLGTEVVNSLVKKIKPENISVLVRDPEKAKSFKAQGIKIHKGDYTDYNSLLQAFKGVDKLYFISTNEMVNREPQHENVVKAAVESKIKHIIYTSFQRKDETENSPIRFLVQVHLYTEKRIKESGIPYTILKHGLYTEFLPNLIGNQVFDTGVLYLPTANSKVAFTSRSDLAAAGVAILTGKGHENKEYNLIGDSLYSFGDIASILSKIGGKPVSFVSPEVEEYKATLSKAGVPDNFVFMLSGCSQAIRQGEFDLADHTLSRLIGRESMRIDTFLSQIYKN